MLLGQVEIKNDTDSLFFFSKKNYLNQAFDTAKGQ